MWLRQFGQGCRSWRWNGTSWSKIGGDSLNSGWTTNFERVALWEYMTVIFTWSRFFVTDAEVWRWNGTNGAKSRRWR